jgi:hypothetical protein
MKLKNGKHNDEIRKPWLQRTFASTTIGASVPLPLPVSVPAGPYFGEGFKRHD